ncbi:shakB [Cordylochernes scorpioides]|uniref:Innexin n=1 Tax=Cordylochernes scorpioides TaxID=51811 RepID=A0ABY6LNF6_9ARAC|nr:shakB [Cordylochernes scorpioides]UYV82598.1 shakB [Cordylochernes scorpioides]
MIDVLRSLKSLVKVSRVQIDNNVFRLHYSFTVLVLMAFCIVVTTRQYVGDPIHCLQKGDVPESLINTYCWIHTTYTIPSTLEKNVGRDIPFPGIGVPENPRDVRYHKYYQWVCFVLFIQAAFFYVPRWLWRAWEGGKVQALMMDMDISLCAEQERAKKRRLVVDYLVASQSTHDWYACKYFLCELMTLANVVGQIFIMDRFFDGQFLTYGLDVVRFLDMDQEDRVDPMIKVFPRITKCNFFRFGSSGSVEKLDALCILPLNILNEKIYIFLWFWFIILSVLTGIVVIFRMVIAACPPVRVYLMNMRFRFLQMSHVQTVVRKGSIGDWFLIYMLGQNIDAVVFKDVISDVAKRLTTEPKETAP